MTEELHAQIKHLIQINGPMGVNALAKSMSDIPLSTLQRYLDTKQSYFKKTKDRKWDLPENVAEQEMSSADGNYATIIESQISGIHASMDLLKGQLNSTLALMSAHKPTKPSVAIKSRQIHSSLLEVEESSHMIAKVIKSKMSDIPEEYQKLLTNVDWIALAVDRGALYVRDIISPEISSLILSETDKLSYEVVKLIEEYQKGQSRT